MCWRYMRYGRRVYARDEASVRKQKDFATYHGARFDPDYASIMLGLIEKDTEFIMHER